jgi:hypothetical protein
VRASPARARLPGLPAALLASSRRPSLETLGAVALYILCTVYLTWPLVTDLGSTFYLFPKNPRGPGDLAGGAAQLRELVAAHHSPFLPGRISNFNAPDGLEIRWALNLASAPSTLFLYCLALVFGATAAYGLYVMLGYVASGTAMFLLARRLTKSAWIGLLSGWAFAFYPFAVVKGEHPEFVHGWVFVVMIWRLLALMERPTVRNGVWAGAATLLALSWTQYFILLGGICFAALTVAALASAAIRRDFRRRLIVHLPSIGLVLAFGLAMRRFLQASGEDATLPGNTLADIVATSAHLPMYLVPPAHNILLGDLTRHYLTEHGWNAVEWTLYVGAIVMLLAVAGVVAALRRRLPPQAVRTVAALSTVLVAAILFSLPPRTEVGGHMLRLPSYLVFEASTGWRLYTRFVVVVMLALCILAAFGLQALSRHRSPRGRAALLVLVTVLVPVDLWDRPPVTTYRVETPRIYSVLRAQPPGIVAEYPLRPVLDARDYLDLYFQEAHGKPILNGYLSGPYEQRALSLTRLDDPATAGKLATLGVRYVLLTPWRVMPGVSDPGHPGRGFRAIARDRYGSLYRVAAKPMPFIYARKGLEPQEAPGIDYRWATGSQVELEVLAPCTSCTGTLQFMSASFGRGRVLKVRAHGGKELLTTYVGPHRRLVSLPLRFSRRIVIDLSTIPGPQSIQETTGLPDPRRVSINLEKPRFLISPRR